MKKNILIAIMLCCIGLLAGCGSEKIRSKASGDAKGDNKKVESTFTAETNDEFNKEVSRQKDLLADDELLVVKMSQNRNNDISGSITTTIGSKDDQVKFTMSSKTDIKGRKTVESFPPYGDRTTKFGGSMKTRPGNCDVSIEATVKSAPKPGNGKKAKFPYLVSGKAEITLLDADSDSTKPVELDLSFGTACIEINELYDLLSSQIDQYFIAQDAQKKTSQTARKSDAKSPQPSKVAVTARK